MKPYGRMASKTRPPRGFCYLFNQTVEPEAFKDFSAFIACSAINTFLWFYFNVTCTSFPRQRATLARKSRDGLYVPLSRRLILDF